MGSGETVTLDEGAVLFGPLVPVLMCQAVRLYDRARGGIQRFPVFAFSNATKTEVAVEMQDRIRRTAGGRTLELTRFLYRLPRVDFTLWVEDDGRLYLADNPSQQLVWLRQGYEELRQAEVGTRSQGFKGRWQGKVERAGSGVDVALDVRLLGDGSFAAALTSLALGLTDAALEKVNERGGRVHFELAAAGILFDGLITSDGAQLEGRWTQQGETTTVTLYRPAGLR